MKETKVNREQLLATLKQNRDKHEREYRRALNNWSKRCKSALKHRLKWFDKKKFRLEKFDLDFGELPKPISYTSQYDQAIQQVEWEVETEITLTEADFKQFVLDEWGWSSHYAATTMSYNSR